MAETLRTERTQTQVSQETIDEINSIGERTNPPVSRVAERLRISVERVSVILERRAIDKAHGRALRENEAFDSQRAAEVEAAQPSAELEESEPDEPIESLEELEEEPLDPEDTARLEQDEAYATYADNIDATARRERRERRQDRVERVKQFFSKMGGISMSFLEAQGVIPLRATWHQQRGAIGWYLRRRRSAQANKEARIQEGFLSQEQRDSLNNEPELVKETEPEEPPVEDEASHEETRDETEPDTKNETSDSSSEETEVLEDTEVDPTEETEEAKEEVRERAREKAARAEARREARRERYAKLGEKANNYKEKAVAIGKKIGRVALRFFKRTGAAAAGAAGAWKGFEG